MRIPLVIIVLAHFLTAVSCSSVWPNPDFYYDFAKVTNVNGVNYVMDQISKDTRYSFGFLPPRSGLCSQANSWGYPYIAPDGAIFNTTSQVLRLPYANQWGLSQYNYTIAMWFKIAPINEQQKETQLLTINNRIKQWAQLEFRITGMAGTTQNYQFILKFNNGQQTFSKGFLQDGWNFVSVSMASQTTAKIRVKTPYWEENSSFTITSFSLGTDQADFDIHIGASCWYGNNAFSGGFQGTMGRLYVWKNFATTAFSYDLTYATTFYKINSCVGTIPCGFCSWEYISNTYKCSTEGGLSPYVANWDFDFDNEQYILDQSGNGYHMTKNSLSDVEAVEGQRVIGQGYLMRTGAIMYLTDNIQFGWYGQWTIEGWIRLAPGGTGQFNLLKIMEIANPSNPPLFSISIIKGAPSKINVKLQQKGGAQFDEVFANLFTSDNWHYFAFTFHWFKSPADNKLKVSLKTVIDQQNVTSVNNFNPNFGSNEWIYWDPATYQQMMESQGDFYVKNIKIYRYGRYRDETIASVTNTSCTPYNPDDLVTSACALCPTETKECIRKCPQNTYSSKCLPCHILCGGCEGPTENDCLYCNLDTTTNIIYSQSFGNCTCQDGFYFDSTSLICMACNTNCKTCYGPTNSNCLSCNNNYFFPESTCVAACTDPLVIGDGSLGYYPVTETNGLEICSKCHPYCLACTGSLSSQCTQCQQGFFKTGTTCLNSCPVGQWADSVLNQCSPCDSTCLTCNGGAASNCIKCTNAAYFQQSGTCQAACNQGFYGASNMICQPCHSYCLLCTTGSNSACSACNTGYFLQYQGFTCDFNCTSGNYPDIASNMCLLCHYSCKTCSTGTADSCIQCKDGYLRRQSLCVTSCADGEFVINNVCQACNPKCLTCYGTSAQECYSCAEDTDGYGFFYFNNTCSKSCPDGFYPDNFDRSCKKCPTNCATCTSSTFCTTCVDGPYQLNSGECTYFLCLENQYRAIKPKLACYECHSSCLTCQGASQFDCLTCRSQYKFVKQQCLTCDEQPGLTEPTEQGATDCVEICGDGFNYGQYQCDDGNKIEGDGCNSKCMIESGFNCTGGSTLTPDICFDIKNPVPSIALVNAVNQVFIQFDEEVTLQDIFDDTSVLVTVSGPQGNNYVFDWKLNDEYKTTEPLQIIMIDMTFRCSLKGGDKESVSIQFKNSKIFVDDAGNGLAQAPLQSNLSPFTYVDPSTKASLDAAGDSTMLTTFAAMGINLGISTIFGGSISAMWTMVNTIQLVSLLPLTAVNYPEIVNIVFQKMLSSHGESTAIPNIFYDKGINRTGTNFKVEEYYNDRFYAYGWTTSNFLELSGRKCLIWLAMVLAYPIIYYMNKKYADKHKFCHFWKGIDQKYHYTLLLRGFIMSYVSMFLAATLAIFKMKFESLENIISAFVGITACIMLVYLPIQIMNILQRNYSRVQSDKFMLQYSTIIKELDVSIPLRYMYYPVFLLRRAVFAILLVLFANSPKTQIATMSAVALLMIIYVVVIRPQKEKIMVILTAAGEVLMLFMHLISIYFIDENLPEDQANKMGFLIIVIVGLYILVNWCIIMTITIMSMKENCKKKKVLKEEFQQKRKLDYQYKKWKKDEQVQRQEERQTEKKNLLEIHQVREDEYMKKKEQENYDNLPQEDEVPQGEEEDRVDENQSPNPFYNPSKHHEVEDAQKQHDFISAMHISNSSRMHPSQQIPQNTQSNEQANSGAFKNLKMNETLRLSTGGNSEGHQEEEDEGNNNKVSSQEDSFRPSNAADGQATPLMQKVDDEQKNEEGNEFTIKRKKQQDEDDGIDEIKWE